MFLKITFNAHKIKKHLLNKERIVYLSKISCISTCSDVMARLFLVNRTPESREESLSNCLSDHCTLQLLPDKSFDQSR